MGLPSYDVIVVGLGTAGSATCMALAARGVSVLGLDAASPPHQLGSHHGESRSIRRAYLEGSAYVPMALRAWERWRKLEQDTGSRLLYRTPNLTLGPVDGSALAGFLSSARTYDIPHEALTAADVRRRWPHLSPPDSLGAGLEIEAGILEPEAAIRVILEEAGKSGAVLKMNEGVEHWTDNDGCVRVMTPQGTYEAGRMLLAAGARNTLLVHGMGIPLVPKQVPVHWIVPPGQQDFRLGEFPVNFWQVPLPGSKDSTRLMEFYSLPVTGISGRIKAAPHNHLANWDPDSPFETVSEQEKDKMRRLLRTYIPCLAHAEIRVDSCLYTSTPDDDFILGLLPQHERVALAALAGHGFKFAPVLGEILADVLVGNQPEFDIELFSMNRFRKKTPV
jgi:sarcosine oxidase